MAWVHPIGRTIDRSFVRASSILDGTRASAKIDSMEIHTLQNAFLQELYIYI